MDPPAGPRQPEAPRPPFSLECSKILNDMGRQSQHIEDKTIIYGAICFIYGVMFFSCTFGITIFLRYYSQYFCFCNQRDKCPLTINLSVLSTAANVTLKKKSLWICLQQRDIFREELTNLM